MFLRWISFLRLPTFITRFADLNFFLQLYCGRISSFDSLCRSKSRNWISIICPRCFFLTCCLYWSAQTRFNLINLISEGRVLFAPLEVTKIKMEASKNKKVTKQQNCERQKSFCFVYVHYVWLPRIGGFAYPYLPPSVTVFNRERVLHETFCRSLSNIGRSSSSSRISLSTMVFQFQVVMKGRDVSPLQVKRMK